MTIPSRAEIWQWLGSAPLPVVLSICLSTSGMLAGWVWAVAAEVRIQQTVAAVAAVKADAANTTAVAVETRLSRMESKLDRLLDKVARIEATDEKAGRAPRPQPPREQTK